MSSHLLLNPTNRGFKSLLKWNYFSPKHRCWIPVVKKPPVNIHTTKQVQYSGAPEILQHKKNRGEHVKSMLVHKNAGLDIHSLSKNAGLEKETSGFNWVFKWIFWVSIAARFFSGCVLCAWNTHEQRSKPSWHFIGLVGLERSLYRLTVLQSPYYRVVPSPHEQISRVLVTAQMYILIGFPLAFIFQSLPLNSPHPGRLLGWNLRIDPLEEENDLNQTIIFRFYVDLRGCIHHHDEILPCSPLPLHLGCAYRIPASLSKLPQHHAGKPAAVSRQILLTWRPKMVRTWSRQRKPRGMIVL